jgi:hypothetical protein
MEFVICAVRDFLDQCGMRTARVVQRKELNSPSANEERDYELALSASRNLRGLNVASATSAPTHLAHNTRNVKKNGVRNSREGCSMLTGERSAPVAEKGNSSFLAWTIFKTTALNIGAPLIRNMEQGERVFMDGSGVTSFPQGIKCFA